MQNMFRKHGLARRLVALLTAVLFLWGEAQVFLQTPLAVMAADNDDAADVSGNEADREGLALTVSEVQYGEDGSNAEGNLDTIFAPVLSVEAVKLVLNTDYKVSYKFFDDPEAAAAVDADNFAEVKGAELSAFDAGTELTVVALAEAGEAKYITSAAFTVAKRKVTVSYSQGADSAVKGQDIGDDGKYTFSADDLDYSALSIKAEGAFAPDLPNAEDVVEGDVLVDMSGVDRYEDGTWTVPMELTFSDLFEKRIMR